MKKVFSLVAMGVVAASLMACSGSAPKNAAAPASSVEQVAPASPLNVKRAEVQTTAAKVEAIDLKTRMVTLRSLEGKVFTIHVGKEAVNLPQVKKGDLVEITYGQELTVRLADPGEVRDDQVSVVTGAKPGAQPHGVGYTETNVTAKILELDKTNELAKMEFADGTIAVVKVQNPANLDKVKVGDSIAITYIEVVEISVKKGKKK